MVRAREIKGFDVRQSRMIENLLDRRRILMEHERERETDERLLRRSLGCSVRICGNDSLDMDEEQEEDGEESTGELTDSYVYSDQDEECLVPFYWGVWRHCPCVDCNKNGSDEHDRDPHSDIFWRVA